MPSITGLRSRMVFDSRGTKTIEIDITTDKKFFGRASAPSGASVGTHEAQSFPSNSPEKALEVFKANELKFIGLDGENQRQIFDALRSIDGTETYSVVGGAVAYALSLASIESASKALAMPMFMLLKRHKPYRFPFPLGNILGGGAHAGPGTPDIQEILVCANGSKTIREAIEVNFAVHKELGKILAKREPSFTNGRGDEGGWAPRLKNDEALEMCASACEQLGFTLGKEVSLGVDFASSTQWNEKKKKYVYERAGFENTPEEQIEFAANIIKKYKLAYAEDAVHEEAFDEMAILAEKFPNVLITGDDLLVTNTEILKRAARVKACNAAILKVNQAGSLYDALEFAKEATKNNIKIITSHRSGESVDSHISHIGIATKSKMLKIGVVGGERIAKLNELLRIAEHGLIRGMAEI